MIDDGVITSTSVEQCNLESKVLEIYREYLEDGVLAEDPDLILTRKQHIKYLHGGLGELPSGFISLDASRTWICYWITHALALLEAPLPDGLPKSAVIDFLASCQHPDGGFGGGPYQLAHLAPTYAAVAALVTLGGEEAFQVVDRKTLWGFLLRMCLPPESGGGMTMHEGGEVDVRGCYCALAVCHMLNLDKQALAQACGMEQYIKACQSYEGGLGGEPWNEAHGGYTFCGLAALVLLGREAAVNVPSLLRWAVGRQGCMEGGFMGRTNKLVDGCYSYWQGALFPLLQQLFGAQLAQRAQQLGGEGGKVEDGRKGDEGKSCDRGLVEAARAVAAGLLSEGDEEGAFVRGLQPLPPTAAAEEEVGVRQVQLDDLVDQSLQADERRKVEGGGEGEGEGAEAALQQESAALLEQAAEAQKAVDRAITHVELTQCSATALMSAATGSFQQEGTAGKQGPPAAPLYNTHALQLWILKCCQAMRGGLRDKPGKPSDYYHSCYCLSGLSASQHYSQVVLGGAGNLLAKADPVCNVVESKLEECKRYHEKLGQPA